MKHLRLSVVLGALTLLFLQARARADAQFIKLDDIDVKSLLAAPPADGSPEQQAEIATLLDRQGKRTPDEVARAKSEEEDTVFTFADVLGPWFNDHDLPATATLMHEVQKETKSATNAAKKVWDRKRPFLSDTRLEPCVVLEKSASYPSGHATRGIVFATLLAEIFPEHREQLLARGKLIGEDRIIGGVHYPSDVAAGQKLGAAIAAKMLADPNFKAELEKVKDECLAEAGAKK